MEVEFAEPGRLERAEPPAAAEVAVMEQPAFGAGEDEPFVAWLGEAGQVPVDDGDDHIRDRYDSGARCGFGRAERESAAYLGQLPGDADGAGGQVDIASSERAEFGPIAGC